MRLVPTLMIAGGTLAAGTFLACGRSQPAAAASAAATSAAPATPASLQGQVLEVLEAAPYTYLRLRTAQGELWTAVPAAPVKPGDPVTVLAQVRMDNFQSATLHRTFPAVYMGTLAGAGPAAAPAATAMPPAAMPAPAMPPAAMAAMTAPAPGHGSGPAHGAAPFAPTAKVPRAAGPEGHTIAELYARQDSLKDRPVAVRARILRYMPGIMGKTWIHLADGSGKPATRDFDLTVTTQDTAKVGDVVTVKGILHLKRDVGAGYVYPVIIEDAKLAR